MARGGPFLSRSSVVCSTVRGASPPPRRDAPTHDNPPCSRTTAAAVRILGILPTPSAVAAVSFAKDECTHSDRRHRARSAYQPAALALLGGGFSAKVNVLKRSSSGSAAQVRTVARECAAADIIAQRAGRGEQGRTADGIPRAEGRCRSCHLHRQRPGCQMRAVSTLCSMHLVHRREVDRRCE